MTQLTKADHKLFRGTAAEVHSWMSNKEILKSIGCDFDVADDYSLGKFEKLYDLS